MALPVLILLAACGDGSIEIDVIPGLPYTSSVLFPRDGEATTLYVEIAGTAEQRARGLIGRESLPEDAGMLFQFDQDSQGGFWMKDTPLPLSIAFVSAEGVVVDIQDMQPFSTDLHISRQPYRMAIEVNQGWFQRHNIGVGSRVELPSRR